MMADKPRYEELEQKVKKLEKTIKKRHQAEKRLQEQNSLLHDVLEGTTDSIFVKDRQSRYILLNTETAHGLGKASVEEVIGKSDTEFIHIEQARKLREHDIGIMTSGKSTIREEVVGTTDSPRIYQTMKAPRYDHAGNVIGVIGIARDITDQKKLETALRESEKNYRLMFETMVSGFALLEMMYDESGKPIDCRYIEANPAHEELTGLKTTEIIDRTARESIPGLEDSWIEDYGQVDRTGKPMEIENYVEGLKSWYKVFAYRTKPGFVAITFENITDSKQAEEALRESEEKYRTLVETNPYGFQEIDSAGIITYANVTFQKMTGYTGEELFGESILNLLEPVSGRDEMREYLSILVKEQPQPTIYFQKLRTKDGRIIDIEVAWRYNRDNKGGVVGFSSIITDVTERKRAEKILRDGEERLSIALQGSNSGIWDWYIKTGKVFFDDNYFKISGYVPNEFPHSYEEWKKRVHTDDIEKTERKIKSYITGKTKEYSAEFRFKTKTNDWMWIHSKGKIFEYDDHGNPARFTGTHLDITERKEAEEALRKSEALLQAAMDQSQAGIAIADAPDGKLRYVNYSGLGIRGKAKEEIVDGIGIEQYVASWQILHFDGTPYKDDEVPLARAIMYGEVCSKEFIVRRPDEEDRIVLANAAPIFDDKGEVSAGIVVFLDVTDRKQAEDALRDSEERYKALFERSLELVYLCDFEGNFIDANDAALKSLGYTKKDIKSLNFSSLLTEDQFPLAIETVEDILKTGFQEDVVEYKLRRKDGEHIFIESKGAIIYRDGKPYAIQGIARNITDRKQAEEKRKQLQAQLQQALKMEAMGTLAGGIAHDFNNLLMAIQGRTSIMLMKKDSSHPDIRHLKGIEDNVESAADLTRQLLGFARGGKYEVKPTDLNELVKKQNRMFGRTKKEIAIRGKYEKDLWSVEVDQGQIEQVLLNLYVNAWQAMPAGGDLYLETENVTLDKNYVKPFAIEPGKYVKISVTDTGVGMDKETQKKIFEPFFTTKEIGRGTGLGLASVYGIIKNHDGFINVYSEKGHGTTFNIYLPASEKEITEEKKPAGDTVRGSETVLFVDDEDMIIEIAGEMFEQLGYKVLTARSGKEAIEIYTENKGHIDLVLLDMIMPDMSGSDTYDRIKKIDPKVKVLLSSGYSINGQATEIMDRGCNGFIQKPFKMNELSQKLREILDDK